VTRTLRRHLTEAALEIGRILNTVADDDERDELHGHVEKVLNDELFAGSQLRSTANVVPLRRHGIGQVVDIFSRKVRRDLAVDRRGARRRAHRRLHARRARHGSASQRVARAGARPHLPVSERRPVTAAPFSLASLEQDANGDTNANGNVSVPPDVLSALIEVVDAASVFGDEPLDVEDSSTPQAVEVTVGQLRRLYAALVRFGQ
jgi:hypothetical protein